MNNTTTTFASSSPYGLGQGGKIGSFGYGIGLSVGILFLITTITLASYFCTRTPPPPPSHARRRTHHGPPNPSAVDVEAPGLDEEVLNGYPKLLYSQAKLREDSSTASCCSICLADYKDSDVLRVLPDCGHLFHQKCVDAWLRLHPTCPVCRSSPLPTPLSTPLAEVVPLARSAS